jgi:hypothetical protein
MLKFNNNIAYLSIVIFSALLTSLAFDLNAAEIENIQGIQADIVWSESDGEDHEIFYSCLTGNTWSTEIRLTDDQMMNTYPAVTSGADGTIWVVWVELNGSESRLSFCRHHGNEWSHPETITTGLSSNVSPSIIVDRHDVVWIVWAGFDQRDDDIFFSRWNGFKWQFPLRVNQNDSTPDILPLMGLDERGNPFVYWLGYRDGSYRVYYSKWNGLEWEYETETDDEKIYHTLIKNDKNVIPTLPGFISELNTASLHIRKKGKIQSIPLRYLGE